MYEVVEPEQVILLFLHWLQLVSAENKFKKVNWDKAWMVSDKCKSKRRQS